MEEGLYTTASVTCNWAGAEIQKPLAKYLKKKRVTYLPTDGRTYGHTDIHTDTPSYRVASPRLKRYLYSTSNLAFKTASAVCTMVSDVPMSE